MRSFEPCSWAALQASEERRGRSHRQLMGAKAAGVSLKSARVSILQVPMPLPFPIQPMPLPPRKAAVLKLPDGYHEA